MSLTKKRLFKLASLLMLGVVLVGGTLTIFNLNRTSIYNKLEDLYLIPKPEKLTELYFNDNANLPGIAVDNQVTGTYDGAIFDSSSRVKTRLLLTGVRENQGNITGYLNLGSGQQGSGPFSGTIDPAKHIRLTVTDSTGHATIFFDGTMQSAISLKGDYYRCSLNSTRNNHCTQAPGGQGIWSLVPEFSFTFIIHNLETTDYRYTYEVSVNAAGGARRIVDSGNVLVGNNRYFVKNEIFNLVNSLGRQEVVVELTNLQQSIDFWIGTN